MYMIYKCANEFSQFFFSRRVERLKGNQSNMSESKLSNLLYAAFLTFGTFYCLLAVYLFLNHLASTDLRWRVELSLKYHIQTVNISTYNSFVACVYQRWLVISFIFPFESTLAIALTPFWPFECNLAINYLL